MRYSRFITRNDKWMLESDFSTALGVSYDTARHIMNQMMRTAKFAKP